MFNRTGNKSIRILATLLLLFFCGSVFAQQAQEREPKHALWRVRSKTNTVYLLGSVHVLKQDAYPLAGVIEEAYKNSPRLFFEMNLDEADSPKMQQLMADKGVHHDGKTLKDALSPGVFALAKKQLEHEGMSIEQFEPFKVWLLAISLEAAELQRLGLDPNQGIDKYFFGKAKKDGKKIEGFETGEYQLNLLSDMPDKLQEAMLLQILSDIDDAGKEIDSIIEAWKSGSSDELDKILLKSFHDFPDVYQRLVIDRNRNWLPRIEALIGKNENALIIVGAAHLIGKDGILAALKRDGYQVEQL